MDRPNQYTITAKVILMVAPLVFSTTAWPCAVCGGGPVDATSDVFIGSTIVLSLVPLCAMGALIYLLIKSYRRQQGVALEKGEPEATA
jgi:hypothetical protein